MNEKATKTTYVKITFGLGKNRLGNPGIYRKGKGKDLYDALENLFRQRGNNWILPEQKLAIIGQFRHCLRQLESSKHVVFENNSVENI